MTDNLAGFHITHTVRRHDHGPIMIITGFDDADPAAPKIRCEWIGVHGFTSGSFAPGDLEIVGTRTIEEVR